MAVIKALLATALLIAAGQSVQGTETSVVQEERDSHLLPRQVVPVHYDVQLIPHIVESNFTGETSIDVKVLEPTDAIVLHTESLVIDKPQTRLSRKVEDGASDAATNYVPIRHDYNNTTEMLTLRFDEPLDTGAYTLYMKFAGVIKNSIRGFYRSFYTNEEGDKVWLAVTHFQPVTARQAFPCWDEPAIKATFKFSIKHYPNYTALSNMPSTRSEVDAADGKVWTRFETTPVMSTNVLAFVIADYDHISNLDGTMKMWGPKHLLHHAPYLLDIAEKVTRELERFTNSTIVVPKMDHVVAPHYSSKATENWGMIVYKLNQLFYNESDRLEEFRILGPTDLKLDSIMLITHELAHQWFGNLVSPAWWSYLWLSEGTATYFKYYITDKIFEKTRAMDLFVVETMQLMFKRDFGEWVKPININITSNVYMAYSSNTYIKSAILLRMMSHFLREDVFRDGLIKYLRENAYSNVTPDDLWKALQDALDESDVPHDDFNVKEVMDTWFEQPKYPIVTVDRDYTSGVITMTQRIVSDHTMNVEENDAKWWVPLNFATRTDLNFSSTLATHWLRPQDEAVTIEGVDVDDWIIVNKQLTGYYRVNYDTTNWKRIAAFLNSDDYAKIPALNRAQIIDDAFFMIQNGQLDLVTFLKIINYMSRETDLVVWQPALKIATVLDSYLTIPEVAEIFKPYFFNLTRKVLEDVGFDDHPNDDSLTTKTRFWLEMYSCAYEHPECQAKATAKLLAYVEDPIANKISFNQRWSICFGLMKADEAVWDKFLQVQNTSMDTLKYHLQFLGCTENMNILEKHLNYIISMENIIHFDDNYYYGLFSNIFQNPSNTDRAIDFFVNNSDRLATFISKAPYSIIVACGKEDQIEKVKTLTKQYRLTSVLSNKEQMLTRVRDYLAEIRSAFENIQLSNITSDNSAL